MSFSFNFQQVFGSYAKNKNEVSTQIIPNPLNWWAGRQFSRCKKANNAKIYEYDIWHDTDCVVKAVGQITGQIWFNVWNIVTTKKTPKLGIF